MAVQVHIPEADAPGFSDSARQKVGDATKNYCRHLISYIQQIEEARRLPHTNPDVTESMVALGVALIPYRKPQRLWTILVRILASVLPFLAGITYDKNALQSEGYMLGYFLLVTFGILFIVLSVIKE